MKIKLLKTLKSIIVAALAMVILCNAGSIVENISGIPGRPQPHYTEYYYKAKSNLNKKQFVDVSISQPAFFGLLNKHDDYSYFCNSTAAVNTLKQQIISQKQLPATNANYIMYNDKGKATNTQVSYPSTDTFTVHEPKTGQDIVKEAQHSEGAMFCEMMNSFMQKLNLIFVVVIIIAEVIVLVNIWRPAEASVSDEQPQVENNKED